MIVLAIPKLAKDLQPGHFFSKAGPEYWDKIEKFKIVGCSIFIRTFAPIPPEELAETTYQIEYERDYGISGKRFRIKTIPTFASEIVTGDLFSTKGTEYWSRFGTFDSLGERLYLRTPYLPGSGDSLYWKIKFVIDD